MGGIPISNIDTAGFLKDFGLYFKKEFSCEINRYFENVVVSEISAIKSELFCINVTWYHNNEKFALTIDMDLEIVKQLYCIGPEDNQETIENELINNNMFPVTIRLPVPFLINVEAELGEVQLSEYEEEFIPFIARKVKAAGLALIPSNIKVASAQEIDAYEGIAAEFFEKVMGVNFADCIITDQSSISDFSPLISEDEIIRNTLDIYKVDVNIISDGSIIQILKLIEATKVSSIN